MLLVNALLAPELTSYDDGALIPRALHVYPSVFEVTGAHPPATNSGGDGIGEGDAAGERFADVPSTVTSEQHRIGPLDLAVVHWVEPSPFPFA